MTETCNICFDNLNKDVSIQTPCDHTFCNNCLTQWLLKNNNCPMCRHNLGEDKPQDINISEDDDEEEFEDEGEILEGTVDKQTIKNIRNIYNTHFRNYINQQLIVAVENLGVEDIWQEIDGDYISVFRHTNKKQMVTTCLDYNSEYSHINIELFLRNMNHYNKRQNRKINKTEKWRTSKKINKFQKRFTNKNRY